MKISELIKQLEEYKEKHGDIPVGYRVTASYWGHIDARLEFNDILVYTRTELDGPKNDMTGPAVMIEIYP